MSLNARNTGPETTKQYLTKAELAAYSGLSLSTIQRLKDERKIPFNQPAGKGGRLLFSRDALERAQTEVATDCQQKQTSRLSGPRPGWQSDKQNKGEK